MSQSIEELHAQRKLIQKHLDWLDQQIREAEAKGSVSRLDVSDKRPETSVPETVAVDPQRIERAGDAESDLTETDYGTIDERLMESSNVSEIKQAQVGCLIFFAAITLLFLFLLFGLPYLLD